MVKLAVIASLFAVYSLTAEAQQVADPYSYAAPQEGKKSMLERF
jgi:hypothetical protein